MVREISNQDRVQIFWETGTKNARIIHNKTGVPLRSVYRYLQKLETGESLERKPYKKRKSKFTSNIVRKIIRKVSNLRRARSTRDIAHHVGIGRESVRRILKKLGFFFRKKQKMFILKAEMAPYFNSLPRRMEQVIESNGGRLNY
jgi:transposase